MKNNKKILQYISNFFSKSKYIALLLISTLYGQQVSITTDITLVSKKIPILNTLTGNILDQLNETVWVQLDIKNNRELYVFFQNDRYSYISIPRGSKQQRPTESFPMKYQAPGSLPNSAIVIIASKEKILFYSLQLISPYFLGISAGFQSADSLQDLTIEDYFQNGTLLQLVY